MTLNPQDHYEPLNTQGYLTQQVVGKGRPHKKETQN